MGDQLYVKGYHIDMDDTEEALEAPTGGNKLTATISKSTKSGHGKSYLSHQEAQNQLCAPDKDMVRFVEFKKKILRVASA